MDTAIDRDIDIPFLSHYLFYAGVAPHKIREGQRFLPCILAEAPVAAEYVQKHAPHLAERPNACVYCNGTKKQEPVFPSDKAWTAGIRVFMNP